MEDAGMKSDKRHIHSIAKGFSDVEK